MKKRRTRILLLLAAGALLAGALLFVQARWVEPALEGEVPPAVTRSPGSSPVAEVARSRDIVRSGEVELAIQATVGVELPPHAERPLRLVVLKSRACLEIRSGGELLKTYPVALGGNPVGAKERQGDQRTPEGEYVLLPHHESPSFGACFYVCYPNALDAERGLRTELITSREAEAIRIAEERERRPAHDTELGGLILLHGTRDRSKAGLTDWHWTLGCIAMENEQLLELLAAFSPEDRPVMEIRP